MKKIVKSTAILLLSVLLLLSLFSCKGKEKTLLSLEYNNKTYTFSLNKYELILSRIKGTLSAGGYTANGYSATQDKFWDYTDIFTDGGEIQTIDEYYKKSLLETCKQYLCAIALFDEYDLSLSDSQKEEIEDKMYEILRTDGSGSKNAVNSVLSEFYVNYDILEEVYEIEEKVDTVKSYLYSNLGDNLKNKYLSENYVHFHQIFFANYEYVYETDDNGDVIYYDADNNEVKYSATVFKETIDGETIYYTDSTHKHISYDKENGTPAYAMEEDGTTYKVTSLSEADYNAKKQTASDLANSLKGKTDSEFIAKENEVSEMSENESGYTDGYYLPLGVSYASSDSAYAYLDEISTWLQSANDGDVALFYSDYGCHIVRKYAMTDKAYDLDENATWFSDFADNLASEYFTTVSETMVSSITVDEEVYALVPSMKEISVNYYY